MRSYDQILNKQGLKRKTKPFEIYGISDGVRLYPISTERG